MNSQEWDERGWTKFKAPSGDIVRIKRYKRLMMNFGNITPQCIKDRKVLADILEIPVEDLLGALHITIDITKHKEDSRRYHLKKYHRYLK